jgi:hypothetical protein
MEHVLAGRTADGADAPVMWALPDVISHPHRATFDQLCYWLMLRLPDDRRGADEVRTFLIWTVSAHLRRLLMNGTMLDFADHVVHAYGNMFIDKLEFLHQLPAARRLMPTMLASMPLEDPAAVREESREFLREMRRVLRRPFNNTPFLAFSEPQWQVFIYRNPWDFTFNPLLAEKWQAHLSAVMRGETADHAYWSEVAGWRREIYSLLVAGVPKATWESFDGQLTNLFVITPDDPVLWRHLAGAITRLRVIDGNNLKYDRNTTDPFISRLHQEYVDGAKRLEQTLKEIRKRKGWRERFKKPLAAAKKGLPHVCIIAMLSFLAPLLVVAAPHFARTYVHVWKVVLGTEPDCMYPAPVKPSTGLDCLEPEKQP